MKHPQRFGVGLQRDVKAISGPADFALIASRTSDTGKCREFSGIGRRHGAC